MIRYLIITILLLGSPPFSGGETISDTGLKEGIFFFPGIDIRTSIVEKAESYLGVPYLLGGQSAEGVDCSGLVYTVYKDIASSLPRAVDRLMETGWAVRNNLLPGDLLFFDTLNSLENIGKTASHVGIYIGSGYLIHAASEGKKTGVIKSYLGKDYYRCRFIGARRLVDPLTPVCEFIIKRGTKRTLNITGTRINGPLDIVFTLPNGSSESFEFEVYKDGDLYCKKRLVLHGGEKRFERVKIGSSHEWRLILTSSAHTYYEITFS